MGKHKKSSHNRPAASDVQNNSPTGIKAKDSDDLKADVDKKIDLLTSRLIDICGQKPDSQQPVTTNLLWKEHLEIRGIVAEIREMQKSFSNFENSDSNRGELLQNLVDWCNKNGLRADGVSIAGFDDQGSVNFGLRAEKEFEGGDLAVRVPRRLFLSVENGLQRNKPLQKAFEMDPLLSGMPNVALSFLIAVEKTKGSDSFWNPYLNSLPSIYETPLTFLLDGDLKLIEALRGSVAFEETLKLYKNMVRQYAYFHQMLSATSSVLSPVSKLLPRRKFNFDLYLWAAVTVMTRINFVPSAESGGQRDGKMVPALIPFFDMANHGDVPPCTDFIDDVDDSGHHCAVIYASKSYKPQDQLLIYYGERKYWEFFVYNGFVYDDGRRYPNVIVKLGVSNTDRLLESKLAALQRFGLQSSEQFLISKYPHGEDGAPFPISMQRFALVFCSNEEELDTFRKSDLGADQFEWSITTVDEARRFLLTRLSLLLRTYTATSEAETTSASAEFSADDRRMGLVRKFVRGETESLKSAVAFLESQRQ